MNKTVRMTATIAAPIPVEQIRRIILPIRGDASYHHLDLSVSVRQSAGNAHSVTYQPTRPFILESALWKDAVWRLHGTPGELESAHITMEQTETDITTPSAVETGIGTHLLLQLTIHQPGYLSIVWDKFTSNYRNLWKTVPYNQYFINSVFIATASTLLTLFFCSLGGYAFAKYQFRGQKILFGILLASMMVPFSSAACPAIRIDV